MAGDVVIEEVPRFTRRYSDHVVEGSNNTLIILGTDRAANGPASRDTGNGKGSGTIHIIAGRKGKDPDLKDDASYLYISQKTKADTYTNLKDIEKASDDKPSAILKTDVLRLVGRVNIKICANDDLKHYIFIDGSKITIKMKDNVIEMTESEAHVNVGNTKFSMNGSLIKIDSPEVHLKGGCEQPWKKRFEAIEDYLEGHGHISAVGPTLLASGSPLSKAKTPALLAAKTEWDMKAWE